MKIMKNIRKKWKIRESLRKQIYHPMQAFISGKIMKIIGK